MSITLIPSTYEFSEFKPSWKNFRAYTFTFLIYDEWEWKKESFNRIASAPGVKFYAISPLHNLDCKADGTRDKGHYHCIVRFYNARSAYQVCKDFLLTCAVKKVKSFGGICRYLIHNDNPEKYQYNIDDVITNDYPLFSSQFDLKDFDSSDVDEIYFLEEVFRKIRQGDFNFELQIALWSKVNGYGKYFVRYKYQIHADFVSTKLAASNKENNNMNGD